MRTICYLSLVVFSLTTHELRNDDDDDDDDDGDDDDDNGDDNGGDDDDVTFYRVHPNVSKAKETSARGTGETNLGSLCCTIQVKNWKLYPRLFFLAAIHS